MEQRLILIDAQSEIYSVKEVVPENKAVARLHRILSCFNGIKNKPSMPDAHLKVTTGIYNPEIPFK